VSQAVTYNEEELYRTRLKTDNT